MKLHFEKGIAVYPKTKRSNNAGEVNRYNFHEWEVGSSFVGDWKACAAARQWAYQCLSKVTQRKIGPGKYRVWRVA